MPACRACKRPGSRQNLQFSARLLAPLNAPTQTDAAWGFWTNLQPFRIEVAAHGTNLTVGGLAMETADCSAGLERPPTGDHPISSRLGGGGGRPVRLEVGTRDWTSR